MPIKIILLLLMLAYSGLTTAEQRAIIEPTFIYNASAEESVPQRFNDVMPWVESKTDLDGVKLSGGDYWMVSALMVNSQQNRWIVNVKNSIIESIDYWVLGDDGSRQHIHSGYYAPYEFLFNYGRSVELNIGVNYWLVTRIDSRYFSSQPKLQLEEYQQYRLQSDIYAMLVLLCLGGLLFIAIYNGLIYLSIKDKAFLYYALYVLCYGAGWALTFHIPAHLFDVYGLEVHHLFFISLPIFNILFYKHFLKLPELSPKLWLLSLGLLWLCIIALPSSIFLLSYTAVIASVLIMLWIALAMVCGNVCLLKGFYPARYFLLAFTCLLLPAVMILPGNMGLTPDFFDNAELATLLGGTADALLLSFALAYKIRLLSDEKERHIETLEVARKNARTDKLTGLLNRVAFDDNMSNGLPLGPNASTQMCLALVALEGLPTLTKRLGHNEVDNLICGVADSLELLCEQSFLRGESREFCHNYRIAENHFVIVCEAERFSKVQQQIKEIQVSYLVGQYSEVSVHIGCSVNTDARDLRQWLRQAEHQLYSNKSDKRRELYTQALRQSGSIE
ncbi:7TM diverse intracellular signaling domain-containing protein [Shewanella sp. 10N.261.52.F9]|uniref:7TM diverse intracellular signaling domain-containing protein n=1 Tax=Shewanella sp. 10N.261.52.F9 TaxID=3229684 RepID=UPI003550BDF9